MDGPGDYHTKWSKSDKERQISYDIAYMQSPEKNDTNELIYKAETDSQTCEQTYGYQRGSMEGRDRLGIWDWLVHTAIFKIDNQQGPTV